MGDVIVISWLIAFKSRQQVFVDATTYSIHIENKLNILLRIQPVLWCKTITIFFFYKLKEIYTLEIFKCTTVNALLQSFMLHISPWQVSSTLTSIAKWTFKQKIGSSFKVPAWDLNFIIMFDSNDWRKYLYSVMSLYLLTL